jgi:hypothetical protein
VANVNSTAPGVLRIVYEFHDVGENVPGGLKGKPVATGTLSAACGAATGALANMSVSIGLVPRQRLDGTFPPPVDPLVDAWLVACPALPDPGPFQVAVDMPLGLKVGDQCHSRREQMIACKERMVLSQLDTEHARE